MNNLAYFDFIIRHIAFMRTYMRQMMNYKHITSYYEKLLFTYFIDILIILIFVSMPPLNK